MMFPPSPFTRFLQRVSAGYYGWLDLREALTIEPFYSPAKTFVLFNAYEANVDRMIELLSKREYVIRGEHVSPRPVHDGYVALLELVPSKVVEDVPARLRAFIQREGERGAEHYLRSCYGEESEQVDELLEHEVFRLMDYPMFDQGSGLIAFGLMITNDAAWLWSRFSFAHK